MRNLAKKVMRDRIMWVLARIMTHLYKEVDSRRGDTITFTIERAQFITENDKRGIEGELVERYTYHWSIEENTDYMLHVTETKQLNAEMELVTVNMDVEEVDMDTFFDEKSKAGGWSKGRTAGRDPNGRPSVFDQRYMSAEELHDL